MNMRFNVPGCHTLGIHGQDLLLDILAHAGLVLFQQLRLKFALTVPGDGHAHFSETGAQCFAAVSVPTVVRVLVPVVVLAVPKFVIQLRF